MKAVVAAFNQEKALVGAFSVTTNLRMELFQALLLTVRGVQSVVAVTIVMIVNNIIVIQLIHRPGHSAEY